MFDDMDFIMGVSMPIIINIMMSGMNAFIISVMLLDWLADTEPGYTTYCCGFVSAI